MRKIDKGEPLPSFSDFVRRHHPSKWEDAKDVSRTWRQFILEVEQHHLSGYTEEPVTLDRSHIDHFCKQSLFNALIFEWSNFIVDSTNETYGAKYKDNFVKSRIDNNKLINPATEEASRFFKYEVNGKIAIADGLSDVEKERAIFTRDAFNLNEGSLVERRRVLMNIILDSFSELDDKDVLEALAAEGFTSVVEQLLRERKQLEE